LHDHLKAGKALKMNDHVRRSSAACVAKKKLMLLAAMGQFGFFPHHT